MQTVQQMSILKGEYAKNTQENLRIHAVKTYTEVGFRKVTMSWPYMYSCTGKKKQYL